MSCRQAFRRRYVAIAREAVGASPATMFRPALAGRMIGATLILRTFGSCARNFPRRRFRARRSPWWTLWTGLGAAGCPQVHRGRGLRLKKRRPKPPFRLWTVFFHPFIGQQFYFHPGKRDFCENRDDLRDFSAGRCSFSVEISNPLVVRHLFPAIPVFQCILSCRHRHNTLPFDQRLPPRSPGPLAHRVKGVENGRKPSLDPC